MSIENKENKESKKNKYIEKINCLKNLAGYKIYETEEFYPVNEFIELIKENVEDSYDNQFLYSDFRGLLLENVDLKGFNLGGSTFEKAFIKRSQFSGADMNSCNLKNVKILDCDFNKTNLVFANFENANLQNVYLNNGVLDGADFTNTDVRLCTFLKTSLITTKANGALFRNCFFSGADFTNADFPLNKFIGCSFYQGEFIGTDFRRCDLTVSNFHDAFFADADLSNANLTNADFRITGLHKSFIKEANFTQAELPIEEVFVTAFDFWEAKNLDEALNVDEQYLDFLIESKDLSIDERSGYMSIDTEYTYPEIIAEAFKGSKIGRHYEKILDCYKDKVFNLFDSYPNQIPTNLSLRLVNFDAFLANVVMNHSYISCVPDSFKTKENFLEAIRRFPCDIELLRKEGESANDIHSEIVDVLQQYIDFFAYYRDLDEADLPDDKATRMSWKLFKDILDEDFYVEIIKKYPPFIREIPKEERTKRMGEVEGVIPAYVGTNKDWVEYFKQTGDKYPLINYLINNVENIENYFDENYDIDLYAAFKERYFICELSEEVFTQKIADDLLEIDMNVFRYIPAKFKTVESCIKAIEFDVFNFVYVPDNLKTKEIYLKAFNVNSLMIDVLPKEMINEEVLNKFKEGVFKCDYYFEVKEEYLTEEIAESLMSKDKESSLLYIPERFKTEKVCLAAVKSDSKNLGYVPENLKTKEMCWAAIQSDHLAFFAPDYTPKKYQTQEYWETALKHNGFSYTRMIDLNEGVEITEQMYLDAVTTHGELLKNVPDEYLTPKMIKAAAFSKSREVDIGYIPYTFWKREPKIDLQELEKVNGA